MDYLITIEQITKVNSLEELMTIYTKIDFGENKFDTIKYPSLTYKISEKEFEIFLHKGIFNEEGKINSNYFNQANEASALEKLLFAYIWKRGELNRFPSLISGLRGKEHSNKNNYVMNQFGKYLAEDQIYEPIVDQHVIRAYKTYLNPNRKYNSTVNKKWVNKYRIWMYKILENIETQEKNQALKIIDELMFGIGKSIKSGYKLSE